MLSVYSVDQFVIPGTKIRIGLDGLIGMVPIAGDLVGLALSAYIIYLARTLNVSRTLLARMIWNVAVDAGVGAIPVAGDLFDVMYKANVKNVRLLEKHLHKRRAQRR